MRRPYAKVGSSTSIDDSALPEVTRPLAACACRCDKPNRQCPSSVIALLGRDATEGGASRQFVCDQWMNRPCPTSIASSRSRSTLRAACAEDGRRRSRLRYERHHAQRGPGTTSQPERSEYERAAGRWQLVQVRHALDCDLVCLRDLRV